MTWECVIGLEVHVQLATKTKMFCAAANAYGELPNTLVDPYTLGLPGALPVPNEEAVMLGTLAALALGCTVHPVSIFARKHYFYPDLPKGYQISQFERPLATGGKVVIESPERGRITLGVTRLHLEEDAGKSLHDRLPGRTAVDLNRAGVPLAEIVSEPDMRSPAEARAYLVALKQLLVYSDVSECSMEKGTLRVDANVSVRRVGETKFGTKTEVKNLNSFANVERAIEVERDRQVAMLERGERAGLLKMRTPEEVANVLAAGFGVTVCGRHLAGVAGLMTAPYVGDRAGEIVGLYTITRFKGEGIGERLVERILTEAETMGLEYVFAVTLDGLADVREARARAPGLGHAASVLDSDGSASRRSRRRYKVRRARPSTCAAWVLLPFTARRTRRM